MHTAIAVAHGHKLLTCNVPCENLYKVQIFLLKKILKCKNLSINMQKKFNLSVFNCFP